jgi:hypothetical protein
MNRKGIKERKEEMRGAKGMLLMFFFLTGTSRPEEAGQCPKGPRKAS